MRVGALCLSLFDRTLHRAINKAVLSGHRSQEFNLFRLQLIFAATVACSSHVTYALDHLVLDHARFESVNQGFTLKT